MTQTIPHIIIESEITKIINFALQQNRIPVVKKIFINNPNIELLENVVLRITTIPEFTLPYEKILQCVPAEQTITINDIALILNAESLASMTERMIGTLIITLSKDGEDLSFQTEEIIVLAYDEWHGSAFYPELLAAFVTPNHPEITKLTIKASKILREWTGNQSLDAYQSRNPDRVKKQMAAVYAAIQEQNIIYSVPPASFEITGQRVRLCDAVIQQHIGTCLDLTLLYASCLEAMGLRPLLILQKGHIFAGSWLNDLSFPESVSDDPSLITKRISDDIGEIAIVECTALTAGKNISYSEAESAAIQSIQGIESLEYIIDVHRARLSGIRPLAMRIQTDNGWVIEYDKRNVDEITDAPQDMQAAVTLTEGGAAVATKRSQWERKLLDLGLRNTLISMRFSRNIIPILTSSVGDLEDTLASGVDLGIMSRPIEWAQQAEAAYDFESIGKLGAYTQLIQAEFKNNRLRSPLSENELNNAIVNLYRTSKTSLEENGTNTLYLSCGLLRWFESKVSEKARYAPIVLLPVEIIRKSANKGYVIRLRDDEPQMNITLLEMLKQDFGIIINGLDPLPMDEHGINIRDVFAIMRHAVMAQPRWDVIESSFLGIFSFSQYVMWNDMRNRYDDLEKNKIVKSLMDGKLAWEAENMSIGEKVLEGEVFLPIPADASQLFAIESAGKGKSFVLHGPPGTGKSQTITALIANAVAQGKTVLFVAEKMAALSVVQKRLDNLGIGAFCLEIHSNKSRKKDVLEQLRIATEVRGNQSSEAYGRTAARTAALRAELDEYADKLHQTRVSGLSLYNMISLYEANREADDAISFDKSFALSLNADKLQEIEFLLGRMSAAAKPIGHPHNHKLRAIRKSVYSQHIRTELPGAVKAYQASLQMINNTCTAFCSALELNQPYKQSDWKNLSEIATELKRWKQTPRSWAEIAQMNEYINNVTVFLQHAKKADENKEILLADWKPELLQQNGLLLESDWKTASEKWFLFRVIAQKQVIKRLAYLCKSSVNKEHIPYILSLLVEFQAEKQTADEMLLSLGVELQNICAGGNTDWDYISNICDISRNSGARLAELSGSNSLRMRFAAKRDYYFIIDSFSDAWSEMINAQNHLGVLLGLHFECYGTDNWLLKQLAMCSDILEEKDMLKEWMIWKDISGEICRLGFNAVIDAYEAGISHNSIMPAYRKAIYSALIISTVETDEALNRFSGAVFNEKIEQFKQIDNELTELTKKEIFCRLASKVPDFSKEAAHSSELGILQRAIRSGGRGISVRRLFEQIPNLLPRLCPCMLMSPISAAQYLDPKRPPFDIVVFDEASQLPTCKAVGALARGKDAIIVGDPKQMPPTSFFSGNSIDEENLDIEDLESILDDCLALGMPQSHLLWHYRSRHESLIAFSNNQFYENKLYTFPSVNDRESKVKLIHTNGCFDRGKSRQNRVEAEAIVAELIRSYQDPVHKRYSFGVVTFNISQQNLIDDLFNEACKLNSGLESWAYEAEEPLFIKNLENVQGDERDVILFSIGFGPDKDGKIFMNFGPLNRDGGWRRLNVAVSRARHNMTVFSSMHPDQINLSKTNSKGVAMLKAFLEYAMHGNLSLSEASSELWKTEREGIINSICRSLSNAGYTVQCSVGHSEYRIDIGIVDPRDSERYILGILLDGSAYGSAKTTRDREIAQISVLNGLGWTIHRIWAMDWWDNSRKEIDKLIDKLNYLKKQPIDETYDAADLIKDASTNECIDQKEILMNDLALVFQAQAKGAEIAYNAEDLGKAYAAANLPVEIITPDDYILQGYTKKIENKLRLVLETEAPISETLLIKRILQSCGITRAGNRVQKRSIDILQMLNVQYTEQNGQKFYWVDGQNPLAYEGFRTSGEGGGKREAKDVPVQETANAVYAVLKEQIGLPKEDLIREASKKLGYSRTSPQVVAAVENGIEYAKSTNRILFDNYGYVTLKEI